MKEKIKKILPWKQEKHLSIYFSQKQNKTDKYIKKCSILVINWILSTRIE